MQTEGPALESTLFVVEQLSLGQPQPLESDVTELALWRLVWMRECVLCGAERGRLCFVFGGFTNVWRTHPVRLRLTTPERTRLVTWALRETGRRRQIETADEVEDGD